MVTFFLDRILPKLGFVPQSLTDTAVDTAAIDRTGFNTAILKISNAAATDASAGTIAVSIYDGATSSPLTAVTLNSAIATFSVMADGFHYYYIDITGFNKYFKIKLTPSLTMADATPPAVLASVSVDLCDPMVDPAAGSAGTIYRKA